MRKHTTTKTFEKMTCTPRRFSGSSFTFANVQSSFEYFGGIFFSDNLNYCQL